MKTFIVIVCAFAAVAADRLEGVYLPPSNAATAGGHGLSAPFRDAPVNYHGSHQHQYEASSAYRQPHPGPVPHNTHAHQVERYQPGYYPGQHQYDILRYENLNDGYGSYSFGYDTENHINVHESGQLKNVGTEHESNSVEGVYSYKGLNGEDYKVEYVADENGFRARGAHLPTPPPVPEAILKSIELNAAASSDNDDGQYRETAFNRQYVPPQKFTQNQYIPPQKFTQNQYIPPQKLTQNQYSGYHY